MDEKSRSWGKARVHHSQVSLWHKMKPSIYISLCVSNIMSVVVFFSSFFEQHFNVNYILTVLREFPSPPIPTPSPQTIHIPAKNLWLIGNDWNWCALSIDIMKIESGRSWEGGVNFKWINEKNPKKSQDPDMVLFFFFLGKLRPQPFINYQQYFRFFCFYSAALGKQKDNTTK